MKEYNQAFKDALQFVSKFAYMSNRTKTLQYEITNISHWIDENPEASKVQLLQKLAEIMRQFKVDEPRY